jgi:hypothetical protein
MPGEIERVDGRVLRKRIDVEEPGVQIDAEAVESHGAPGLTFYGVGCGDQRDGDPEYRFLVSADGEYVVDSAGSKPGNVLAYGSARVNPFGKANKIEASCVRVTFPDATKAVQLALTINGVEVASALDDSYSSAPAWTAGLVASSWTTSTIRVVFKRFALTDEAPSTVLAPTIPRVVYRNLLRDPGTGWLNTNPFSSISGKFVGSRWELQAPADTWTWVRAPFNVQDVSAVTVQATPGYVGGGQQSAAGVTCNDATSHQPAFAFTVDGTGLWAIFHVDDANNLSVLAVGLTSLTSNAVSGTCVPGPGGITHLSLAIGGVPVGTAAYSGAVPADWGGGVGVLAADDGQGATFAFTDFSITRLPMTPQPAITAGRVRLSAARH